MYRKIKVSGRVQKIVFGGIGQGVTRCSGKIVVALALDV